MNLFARLNRNWRMLRQVADELGREFESRPYEALVTGDADEAGQRMIEGYAVSYSAYLVHVHPDGTALFSVDVDAPALTTWLGVKPSYQFVAQPTAADGSFTAVHRAGFPGASGLRPSEQAD